MENKNNLTHSDIEEAMRYIDENGVPDKNKSTEYDVISDSGKKYPPKYVIDIANHIKSNDPISTIEFTTLEAKSLLEKIGYLVERKYILTVTSEEIISNDDEFSMDDLSTGDNRKPTDVYFERQDGSPIRRKKAKNERKLSNQTLPKLAFQIFESEIKDLTSEERADFPILKYTMDSDIIRGIFSSVEEFKKSWRKSRGLLVYTCSDGEQFVIYTWNIFSTLLFVQECLKRFGQKGDKFVLEYTKKTELEKIPEIDFYTIDDERSEALNHYSHVLLESHNIIFHGAPGTGKSYLAKQIAADIISNGETTNYFELTDDQKQQVEFVQFHPSYDYTDFVEGLRPVVNVDGTMGFQLQDGIFKRFVLNARKNYDDSKKSIDAIKEEVKVQSQMDSFLSTIEIGEDEFETMRGSKFYIEDVNDNHITIRIPENAISDKLFINTDDLLKMLQSDKHFDKVKDITDFFDKRNPTQHYSYYLALYDAIQKHHNSEKETQSISIKEKPFIFIIDEINRGEISKIFGELFFAIDPGYRGPSGAIATQYTNLHDDIDEKFYIPNNVYIIGTMNDIDRSVDSFDFAMRRRFRFVELKAEEQLEMLNELGADKDEAIYRMQALNQAISSIEDLNSNFHIGPSYFLKLKSIDYNQLWMDYLEPLLQDYVRGLYNDTEIMSQFLEAYESFEVDYSDEDND